MSISIDVKNNLVVPQTTFAIKQKILSIGNISATAEIKLDFNDIPIEYHEMFIMLLNISQR